MATILLVDDDPLQASFMVSILERRFGEVRRATDAAEALCFIEQPDLASKLSLVISGHHMPGIGGPVFISEIRTRMPNLPVLVLGATGESPKDYPQSRVVFLAKPFGPEEMLSLTGRMLAGQKSAKA
ncbi:MAG: response regulator [Terracidiphilus sp.]